jgi:hypothetical protein
MARHSGSAEWAQEGGLHRADGWNGVRYARLMTSRPKLSAADIETAFRDLGALARDEGLMIDVALYGGSALMLVTNFRAATYDVDAVANDDNQRHLERLADLVGHRRGWPRDWLNDQVFPFLSDKIDGVATDHELFRSYPDAKRPGMRVFVPTAEYMCALKLIALRIDPSTGAKDLDDLRHLIEIIGLTTPDEALALVRQFFDGGTVTARVENGVRRLYDILHGRSETTNAPPPTYFGRGRR